MLTRIVREMGSYRACFNIETNGVLTDEELAKLRWLCAETFEPQLTGEYPTSDEGAVIEIGPRLAVETPDSSNFVAICRAMGVDKVTRVEQSRLYCVAGSSREAILAQHLDKMTQAVVPLGGFKSFFLDTRPEPVRFISVLEDGEAAIASANKQLGLGMDAWDIKFYTQLFQRLGRNPTDVELFQIGNANSEHCRHWFFRGKMVIDGVAMSMSLMDIVRAPLLAIAPETNVTILAFNDNVGASCGVPVPVLVPSAPGMPSKFRIVYRLIHITGSGETHNHPTAIAPFPGAATGAGGRIRDNCAGGRGSMTGFGVAGYAVSNLFIPGYQIAGEVEGGEISDRRASALRILIEGSNGVSAYGNEYGEPLIVGFTRAFDQKIAGERRAYGKPILFSAGIGRIEEDHAQKHDPEAGMLIIAIGGPAYAIGVGGGAASSMMQGENDAGLDFQSVQRGDGEMGNKAVRVIRACLEMGDKNPIQSIHDQGAGGPSNVKTELMGTIGGQVDIRQIVLGDRTMSVLTIWSAEFQERYGLLLAPKDLELFLRICGRERVNCEVLGQVTGDGHVTVVDSADGSTPVRLNLADILGNLPQKTYAFDHLPRQFVPPQIPARLALREAIRTVFQQPSVGSKGYLVHKVDRSVGGRVAQQQCCGATQVPIADVGVLALSPLALAGEAGAVGEQPLKMLIDPEAGARMTVGEMLTNLLAAGPGLDLEAVRCRVNWMWPAKLPGEGALLYDAAQAMSDAMIILGIAADGGKDSSSMAVTIDGQLVKAPGTLVITGYGLVNDITKTLTPDIKRPGMSCLGFIDLGAGKNRLGGSALLQALNQLGDETPDCDPTLLKAAWKAMQELFVAGSVIAYHDRGDGGLMTTVVEMCLGGNCGAELDAALSLEALFSEELGMVIEYYAEDEEKIRQTLARHNAPALQYLGTTTFSETPQVFGIELTTLRGWWEATGHQLEKLQTANGTADEEFAGHAAINRPVYRLGFEPTRTMGHDNFRPLVAILREEGTNGDREMAEAFHLAGLEPVDVTMSDLLAGRVNLDEFRGLVAAGGFSFKDVGDSAKGWAASIRFNKVLAEMFKRFHERSDTFTLGVCNGCQLFALLGWVPWSGMEGTMQPRFIRNRSQRFESRWSQVKIQKSPSILFTGMAGSTLGIHVAHGEGRVYFPDPSVLEVVRSQDLAPLAYVGPANEPTEAYPWNPNGSVQGIAALCSVDGRHNAMMPHPERCYLNWQWPYMPEEWRQYEVSPWLRLFQNAREWCRLSR